MLVFTGVYVCVKAKLTLVSFFSLFFLHLSRRRRRCLLSLSNLKSTRPTITTINTTNMNIEKGAKGGLQSGLFSSKLGQCIAATFYSVSVSEPIPGGGGRWGRRLKKPSPNFENHFLATLVALHLTPVSE